MIFGLDGWQQAASLDKMDLAEVLLGFEFIKTQKATILNGIQKHLCEIWSADDDDVAGVRWPRELGDMPMQFRSTWVGSGLRMTMMWEASGDQESLVTCQAAEARPARFSAGWSLSMMCGLRPSR